MNRASGSAFRPELEGLRGLAILLVAVAHAVDPSPLLPLWITAVEMGELNTAHVAQGTTVH